MLLVILIFMEVSVMSGTNVQENIKPTNIKHFQGKQYKSIPTIKTGNKVLLRVPPIHRLSYFVVVVV
jgi:hypothetical protein